MSQDNNSDDYVDAQDKDKPAEEIDYEDFAGKVKPAAKQAPSASPKGPVHQVKSGKGPMKPPPSAAKRHRSVRFSDNIQGVTNAAIRRLARRAGIRRISGLYYKSIRTEIYNYLSAILKDTIIYTQHARRMTVLTHDVVGALRRRGMTLYGFGH